jgi:hypothetical protein
VRQPPVATFNEGPWGNSIAGFGSSGSSGGLVFAKRKRNVFKGPMLNTASPTTGPSGHSRNGSLSRSTSVAGRRSGEIIEEEDEDEIEEVDVFSPIMGTGEIEEEIYPPGETPADFERKKDMKGGLKLIIDP